MERSITISAPAKINLALDVTGKRPDGYHDLRMIMQTIRLQDKLTITWTPKEEILLECSAPIAGLSDPSQNLIYKAAELLQETCSISGGFHIYLEKNIPAAAGMAGGSSDCAATLLGINALMELGLPEATLRQLGVTLGADVPYCIMKGTALAEGIGDILTPLPAAPALSVLLVKPAIQVSTAFVYGNLNLGEISSHPDVNGMVTSIKKGDKGGIFTRLENILESVTIPAFPEIASIKEELKSSYKADGVLMSGSGPTVFALYESKENCRLAEAAYKKAHPEHFCMATEFC